MQRTFDGQLEQVVPLVVNPAFVTIVQRPAEQLVGLPLDGVFRNFTYRVQEILGKPGPEPNHFALEVQMESVHRPVSLMGVFLDGEHLLMELAEATENQNAEAVLLSIGEMWTFSLEKEGDGVWDWEIPRKTIHYSPRFMEILSISDMPPDVDDFDFRDRIHPEEVDRISRTIHDHVRGNTDSYVAEHRMRTDEGTYKWVITRGKVIKRSPEGRALRMLGTLTDISEQRVITEALKRSQQWLTAFFQSLTHGFFVIDQQNMLFLINETAAQMAGQKVEELRYKKFSGLVFPVDWQELVSPALSGIREGKRTSARMEIRLQGKPGEEFWVECSLSPILNAEKKVDAVAGIFTDITTRKRTAAALLLEQEKLRHSTWLLERRVQELTRLYEIVNVLEQVGTPIEEKLQQVVDILPQAFQRPQNTRARLNVAGKEYVTSDFQEWEHSRICPFLFDGNRRGLLEVFVDDGPEPPSGKRFLQEEQAFLQSVTTQLVLCLEQHTAHEENRFLNTRLRQSQKIEAMGRLTHFVVDDFQEICSEIARNMEALEPLCSGENNSRTYFLAMRHAMQDGQRMLRQLDFLSKSRSLTPVPVHPAEVLGMLMEQFRQRYGGRIRFHLQNSLAVPVVLDMDYFHLLCEHLLQNAAESIAHQGDIHVTTSLVHLENAPDETLSAGQYFQMRVADTGSGMNSEELVHLFEPFYTTKNSKKNNGMGLFVVDGIMKLHQGTIRVQSAPQRGSVFSCWFPLK